MSAHGSAGTILITADTNIGGGKPTRIYCAHVISGAGGGGLLNLRNGTSASATEVIRESGTTNTGETFDYGYEGYRFPAGLFADFANANVVSALITYIIEQ